MKRSVNDLVRKNIRDLRPYSSARDEFKSAAGVFLDANENPYGDGLNRYPDAVHRQLKSRLSARTGVPDEQIILGNGSDEVLDLVFRTFCEPGRDNVIITPPTYGMYRVIADINNVEVRRAYLTPEFELDAEAVIRQTDENTKLVIICSPNNPTGNLMAVTAIEKLLDQLDCLVILDEAYIEFSETAGWSKRLAQFPNLIVVQTFSKAWGLAGIRLGIGMASVDIINMLHKVKPPYNINALTEKKALAAFRDTVQFETNITIILAEREKLSPELSSCPSIMQVYPSEANFLLVKVANADLLYEHLKNKGVIVRNRTNQPGCKNMLRITVGTPGQNQLLIKTLKEYQS
jgi:histidinol-phosphate aminotransferase